MVLTTENIWSAKIYGPQILKLYERPVDENIRSFCVKYTVQKNSKSSMSENIRSSRWKYTAPENHKWLFEDRIFYALRTVYFKPIFFPKMRPYIFSSGPYIFRRWPYIFKDRIFYFSGPYILVSNRRILQSDIHFNSVTVPHKTDHHNIKLFGHW